MPVTVAAWAVTMDRPMIATKRHTSVNSLGIVFFMLVLSPNAKDRQLTLSVFWSGIQLVYPYSTTTMYSSDAAS